MHKVFKTLGCEHRVKILKDLLDRDDFVCICQMEDLIDRDRSVVYRHFKKLEEQGFIETRKKGGKVECKLRKPDQIERLFDVVDEISKE